MKDLATKYNPAEVEDRIYQTWLDGKYFHANLDERKTPYTIVIPPPNHATKIIQTYITSSKNGLFKITKLSANL